MSYCVKCDGLISADRLEAINDFGLSMTCMSCSTTQAPAVFMSYEHKTAGTLFVVPNNPDGSRNEERVRQARRCFNRER